MNKSILSIQGLDEELKVACRKCGGEMVSEDMGVGHNVQGEEYDLGFVWHCKSCGHTEDE